VLLIAVGIIMVGKRMGRSASQQPAAIIPPGGRIKEETMENTSVADMNNVDMNIGGRLRYPSHDITTGARLGEEV
jgi:hypothetical protein